MVHTCSAVLTVGLLAALFVTSLAAAGGTGEGAWAFTGAFPPVTPWGAAGTSSSLATSEPIAGQPVGDAGGAARTRRALRADPAFDPGTARDAGDTDRTGHTLRARRAGRSGPGRPRRADRALDPFVALQALGPDERGGALARGQARDALRARRPLHGAVGGHGGVRRVAREPQLEYRAERCRP